MDPLDKNKTQSVQNIQKCVDDCEKLCSDENMTPFDEAIKLLTQNLYAIKAECEKILE